MRLFTITICLAAVVFMACLHCSARGAEPSPEIQPHIVSVTHYTYTVTVWSDYTVDLSSAEPLDARSAARLAARLQAQAERLARMARQARAQANRAKNSQPDPDTTDTLTSTPTTPDRPIQCQAVAVSTGKRCRNSAISGTPYCKVHSWTEKKRTRKE